MNTFKKLLFFSTLFAGMIAGSTDKGYGFFYDDFQTRTFDNGITTTQLRGPILIGNDHDLQDMHNMPTILEQFPQTRILALRNQITIIYPQISGEVLATISHFQQLTELILQRVNLTIESSFLKRLPCSLKVLKLQDCTFNPELLSQLPENITTLALSGPQITASYLSHLPKTLRKLRLDSCPNIIDRDLMALPTELSSLEIVVCAALTNYCIHFLPESLREVEFTAAANQILITDEEISLLPQQLTALTISRVAAHQPAPVIVTERGITDRGLLRLPQDLTTLEIYDNCEHLTDEGLCSLRKKVTLLRLCNARHITAAGLAAALPEHGRLGLINCSHINSNLLSELHPTLRFIQKIEVFRSFTEN